MKKSKLIFSFLLILVFYQSVAQRSKTREAAILFGLNQPILLDGFNVEVNYFTNKFSFDYSHGVSLEYKNGMASTDMKTQHLVAHLPFSTGFGIGYRFTSWINLRIEPKWHRFEIYYEGDSKMPSNSVVSYTTSTLGLGLYGKWHPFKKQSNFLRGIMIAPSVRYWPNISNAPFGNDHFTYFNKITNRMEDHKVLNVGAGNTPWLVNISVGYRFTFGKEK